MATIKELYDTLKQRKRPEDVAEIVVNLLGEKLTNKELSILDKAAKGSLSRSIIGYTSMMQEFAKASGATKQVQKAIEIFKLPEIHNDYNNAENIESFIRETSPIIHKDYGNNNFKTDRLNNLQRKEIGLTLSKRNYNKKWRILKRLERKLLTLMRENRKNEFQMVSKHGLAHRLDYDNFVSDLNTACFIAYYNSRCNLRSVFTDQTQSRPFDEIGDMLINRCKGNPSIFSRLLKKDNIGNLNTTNWWAIAHVYTNQEVLSHLSGEQKGKLLGEWTTVLQDIAGLLSEIWNANHIDRQTMIVKRGNDSTTWNNTAGAWNKARDNWMNLIYSLGLEYILGEVCFGKVLRLMAADVVAWHSYSGGSLDENTNIWNKLPLPWDVFEGKEVCNKEMIVNFCREAGIDAERSGWVAPGVHGVAAFKPTPELVHGLSVTNPFLATVLKRHKYFSGKNVKPFSPENN